MNSNVLSIMDQLVGAVNTARMTGRMVYVFQEDQCWFYSGKMPYDNPDCYIVYANGNFDQSGRVPQISLGDWQEYLSQIESPLKFASLDPVIQRGSIVNPYKKILITYAAFSPFISLAIAMLWDKFLPSPDFWTMAFYISLTCIPLSLLFTLSAIQKPKNSKIATMCFMMASDAHLIFYSGLWIVSFHGVEIANSIGPVIACMASLMLSGLALLLMYDNDLQTKVLQE